MNKQTAAWLSDAAYPDIYLAGWPAGSEPATKKSTENHCTKVRSILVDYLNCDIIDDMRDGNGSKKERVQLAADDVDQIEFEASHSLVRNNHSLQERSQQESCQTRSCSRELPVNQIAAKRWRCSRTRRSGSTTTTTPLKQNSILPVHLISVISVAFLSLCLISNDNCPGYSCYSIEASPAAAAATTPLAVTTLAPTTKTTTQSSPQQQQQQPIATTTTPFDAKINDKLAQNHSSTTKAGQHQYDRVDLILDQVNNALDLAFKTPAPTTTSPLAIALQKIATTTTIQATTTTTTNSPPKQDQSKAPIKLTEQQTTATPPTTIKSLDNLIEESEEATEQTGSDDGYSYRGNNDAASAGRADDDPPDCKSLSDDNQEEGKKLSNNEKFIKLQNCIQARIQQRLKAARRSGLELFESMSLSGGCTASLMNIMVGLGSLKSYAFKFMDASAKIPSGVMYGLLSDFGDFDQCLSIRSNRDVDFEHEVEEREFSGKYCLVSVRLDYHVDLEPNNTQLEGIIPDGLLWDDLIKNYWVSKSPKPFQMGMCVPSRCNTDDLEQLVSIFGRRFNSIVELESCQDGGDILRDGSADRAQAIILSVFATIIVLTAIGSYLDRYRPSVIYYATPTKRQKLQQADENDQASASKTIEAAEPIPTPDGATFEQQQQQHLGPPIKLRHSISISQFSRTSHDLGLAQLEEVCLWAQLLICFSIRRNWRIFIRKNADDSINSMGSPPSSKTQSPADGELALRVIPKTFAQCSDNPAGAHQFLNGAIATDPIGRAASSANKFHHRGAPAVVELAAASNRSMAARGAKQGATRAPSMDVIIGDSTAQLISSAKSMRNLNGNNPNLVYDTRRSVSALDLNLTLDLPNDDDGDDGRRAADDRMSSNPRGHDASLLTLNGNKIFADPFEASVSSSSRIPSRLDDRTSDTTTRQLSQMLTVRIKADDDFWVPKPSVSLSHLSGLRLLVIVWITMGMSFLYPSANNYQYYRSIINMNITRDSVWFTTTNYTLGIDMLLYMTGLVFVYKLAHVNFADLISQSPMSSPRRHSAGQSKQIRLNSLGVVSLISKKILRFWPTYLTVIGLAICAPLLSNGPMWPEMVSARLGESCRQNWWSNVLFVNNFLKESEICLPSSWFVSVLMQLFVIGAVIIVLIHKYSVQLAIFTIGLLLLISCSFSFAFAYILDLPAPVIRMDESFVMKINDNIFRLYTNIFNNMGPFLIGMLGGLYLIRSTMVDDEDEDDQMNDNLNTDTSHDLDTEQLTAAAGATNGKLHATTDNNKTMTTPSKLIQAAATAARQHKSSSSATSLNKKKKNHVIKGSNISFGKPKRKFGLTYLFHSMSKVPAWPIVSILTVVVLTSVLHQSYTRFWAAAYWSLHRVCWAICTGFLIHRCATYKWRLLHDILSLSSFIPLSRLIFITYLVFPAFIQMHTGLVRDGLHVTIYNMMNVYVTRLVLATLTALSIHLLVELPFCSIEEILLNLWLENISRRQSELQTNRSSDHHTFHPLLAVAPVVTIQQYNNGNGNGGGGGNNGSGYNTPTSPTRPASATPSPIDPSSAAPTPNARNTPRLLRGQATAMILTPTKMTTTAQPAPNVS